MKNQGGGVKPDIHTLRSVLKKPGTVCLCSIVPIDKAKYLCVGDALARSHALRVAQRMELPFAPSGEREPTIYRRHIGPAFEGVKDGLIHRVFSLQTRLD